MINKKSTIVQKVIIKAAPNEVYDAFMDPKKHSDFTGSRATGKSIAGTIFTAWDGYIKGKNLELEKGKTEITMVHSDVPAAQEADLKQGWIDFYWDPLKNYFGKNPTLT